MPNATGTHAHFTRSAPSGITHVIDRRRRDHRRVRTPQAGRDDALADEAVGDAFADLDDRPRALVADDVRIGRHLATGAVQRVAALDADRADLDQHAARDSPPDRGRPRNAALPEHRSRSRRLLSWLRHLSLRASRNIRRRPARAANPARPSAGRRPWPAGGRGGRRSPTCTRRHRGSGCTRR